MALLCYNKGCGERFDMEKNTDDVCLFHPGVPIFHDALKGWSCCRKRTTDFSEFLSIQGCTRGRHSNEKPREPLRPEVSSDKGDAAPRNGEEIIYQGPKSAEALQRERPSSDEPKTKLPQKVAASLTQVLEKLQLSNKAEQEKKESELVIHGTRCKNSGCKTTYQGPQTDLEICTHHPGAPVFHEGYKYWSCCCIKTIDFNAFLDQKGCTTGKHCWIPKRDKKKVACRYDWHQTGTNVVMTIYAKNANPDATSVEANRTVVTCQIQFENDKLFKKDFHLWGVIDVAGCSVAMVPSKVEVTLRKADAVAWGKLEDPSFRPEPEPAGGAEDDASAETEEAARHPDWDIDDDDISDSDEEWKYDTAPKKKKDEEEQKDEKKKDEEEQKKETENGKEEKEEETHKHGEEEDKKDGSDDEQANDDLPPLED